MTTNISINTRFLLWNNKIPRGEWISWLEKRSDLGLYFVREILYGECMDEKITGTQLRELSRVFNMRADGEATLRLENLPQSRANILVENLKFLLGELPHGGKQELARQIGVDPATISRWRSGAYVPARSSLQSIIVAFGLRADTDLKWEPLFLRVEPVSVSAQRKWLHTQIDKLSTGEVHSLFPSLQRLLADR